MGLMKDTPHTTGRASYRAVAIDAILWDNQTAAYHDEEWLASQLEFGVLAKKVGDAHTESFEEQTKKSGGVGRE